MYVAARRRNLPRLLLTAIFAFSLLSFMILQVVAAEPMHKSRSMDNSIVQSARNDDLFSYVRSVYFALHNEIFLKQPIKPVIHEANNSPQAPELVPQGANELPRTHLAIANGKISWLFFDSRGNQYRLEMTTHEYENWNTQVRSAETLHLETDSGAAISVRDYTSFIQSEPFRTLADQIYDNARNDNQFMYEVWYVVNHSTSYSKEEIETINMPLETLFLGKGDCEDLTILAASIITASSHSKNWQTKLVYFDAHNSSHPDNVNHLATYVDTGKESIFLESTSDSNGLAIWDKVDGWYLDA